MWESLDPMKRVRRVSSKARGSLFVRTDGEAHGRRRFLGMGEGEKGSDEYKVGVG